MKRPLVLAALLAVGLAAIAIAGPPWISIESPANPLDAETRDASFVVRVYHHATPASFKVAGTVEGLVDGERRTLPLSLEATSVAGRYTVARQWPDEGVWTALVTVSDDHDIEVTAIVDLDQGAVSRVRVPTRAEGGRTFPKRGQVSMAMIERELEARAATVAGRR